MESVYICNGNLPPTMIMNHTPNGVSGAAGGGFLTQDPAVTARLQAMMLQQSQALGAMGMSASHLYHPLQHHHQQHQQWAAMASDLRLAGLTPQGGLSAVIMGPFGVNGIVPLTPNGILHHNHQPTQLPFHAMATAAQIPSSATTSMLLETAAASNRMFLNNQLHRQQQLQQQFPDCIPSKAISKRDTDIVFFQKLEQQQRVAAGIRGNKIHQDRLSLSFAPRLAVGSPTLAKKHLLDVSVTAIAAQSSTNKSSNKLTKSSNKLSLASHQFRDVDQEEREAKKARLAAARKDKPKRPMSAYNCFFKEERARILGLISNAEDGNSEHRSIPISRRRRNQHGKISFEELGKTIGQRWQTLSSDEAQYYKDKAAEDMKRYRLQMADYLAKQEREDAAARGNSNNGSSISPNTLGAVARSESPVGAEVVLNRGDAGDQEPPQKKRRIEEELE